MDAPPERRGGAARGLDCEGLESTKTDFAFTVFERTFKDFGLPRAIR